MLWVLGGWLSPVMMVLVCVRCESGILVYMAGPGICIVLGGYLCILGTPSVQSFAPYPYLFTIVYLTVADIGNPDLLACGCRNWISLDITRFKRGAIPAIQRVQ